MKKTEFDIDIFCDVIDNFGDAGVCWRLARSLSQEKKYKVRLFINNLSTLGKIANSVSPNLVSQLCENIQVLDWSFALNAQPSKIVIETFGCRIPNEFEKKIAQKNPGPIWINLEYLSAEDWVEGCHQLPSPHPSLGVNKYFFFPGVTKNTGGLIIEQGLFDKQVSFRANKQKFLSSIGANPDHDFTAFIFCYPSAPLDLFVQALLKDHRPIQLLLAGDQGSIKIKSALEQTTPSIREHISIVCAPMVDQKDFDQFLWASDSLIIRGEDSFARAQLSSIPFIWNIYPQKEDVHLIKLEAFANRVKPYLQDNWEIWKNINFAWNKGSTNLIDLWPIYRDKTSEIAQGLANWNKHLTSIQSLTFNLCKFIQEKLKSNV